MKPINYTAELYEVASQSFRDIPLDEQIALKICDWVAEDNEGHMFYGRTAQQASDQCNNYHFCRATI